MSRFPVDEPVDNWMAQMCRDGDFETYCDRPKIICMCDEWHVNSDAGHSDEAPAEATVFASIPRASLEGSASMQNFHALVSYLDTRPIG